MPQSAPDPVRHEPPPGVDVIVWGLFIGLALLATLMCLAGCLSGDITYVLAGVLTLVPTTFFLVTGLILSGFVPWRTSSVSSG